MFDKIFGTFVPETEQLDYYGLAKQYESFDPVWAHAEHISRVVRNVESGSVHPIAALFRRRVKHKWTFDPLALFRPHPKPTRSLWTLPDKPYRSKVDVKLPFILNVYLSVLFVQQLLVFLIQGEIYKRGELPIGFRLLVRQGLFFWTLSCLGRLLDGFEVGRMMNTLRVFISPVVIFLVVRDDPLLWFGSLTDFVAFMIVSVTLVGTGKS